MSYIAQNPLAFNLRRDYVAPLANEIVFNLGVEIGVGDVEGAIDFTLDDCAGAFVGFLPQKYIGEFSATLDDCAGAISAAWLVAPRSISAGFTIASHSAQSIQLAIQNPTQTTQALSVATNSAIQTADKLSTKTQSTLQQAEKISKRIGHHATDLHTFTHKFDTQLFKEPPPQYRYTPLAVFDFGIHLNEWTLSTTTLEFVTDNPIEFNLVEIIPTGFDFDLGEANLESVTRTRQIFDNVSTYLPENQFFAPWSNDNLIFNHSYQRAALRIGTNAPVKLALKREKAYFFKVQRALKLAFRLSQRSQTAKKFTKQVNFKTQTAKKTASNIHFTTQKAKKLSRRYREIYQIARIIWNSNNLIIVNDPPRPPIVTPPDHVTVTIPTKQVYTMQHSISVTLENLTPISVDGVKLSLDADSFAWSFSANLLDLNQLALVKQPTDAPPITLIITIDGNVFKMLVEKITRNRSFAKNSISLSGRSLSALLSQPYEQPRSATQSTLMTVQQLAELELPNGWTINWTAQTWNVTAGAFSYTAKTPIQVITEIAANIGAIVVPSKDAKVLNIMPRYTVLPWYFDVEAPDLIIPDSSIVSLTYRNIVPTQANAVFVHGSEIGGVLSKCRLSGTAGDKLSATVTNPLMTDVIGTRALGEKILADNYEQPAIQSVSLKLGGDYPLVQIGDFVRINIDGGQVRGVVNSVSIEANLDSVNQTIQIGNESTNVWTAFRELLPSSPLLVGTVASVSGETSLMTLIDGGVIRCRGVGAVNEKWYIRANALESKAPSLTLSEVVI